MENCVFCDPSKVEGGIFYENESLYVVLSTHPFTRGHSIVIPKEHCEFYHEMSSDLLKKINDCLPKIIEGILQVTNTQDYNFINNNGLRANQTIPHVHIHIIPRTSEDEIAKVIVGGRYQYVDGDREKLLGELEMGLCEKAL